MPQPVEIRVSDTIHLSPAVYASDSSPSDRVVQIVLNQRRNSVATLYATPSLPALPLEWEEVTPDHPPEVEPATRLETDWFDSALFLLPKRWREEGLGDLLEDRASWKAGGTSRLSIEIFTMSQLILSALALVWSAAKDLLTEIIRRYLGP
jgi:hypothetical protein